MVRARTTAGVAAVGVAKAVAEPEPTAGLAVAAVAVHGPAGLVPAARAHEMPLALIDAVAPDTPVAIEELSTRAEIFSVGRSQFAA